MGRFVALIALLSLSGCGKPQTMPLEKTAPVTGTAIYNGKPLEGYRVFFNNDENRTATGMVDFEGRFSLGTNAPGDGAPAGTHRVWFAYEPEVEIEAGKETEALVLPPSVELPQKYLNPGTSGLKVDVPESGLTDHKIEFE